MFNSAELNRYARHFSLTEIGLEGQQKLKAAQVLVVGAGGLGSVLLLYLAAAGVGHIGIIDGDVVEESNLQRQVLYTMKDLGKLKAAAAKKRLEALNPYIHITAYSFALDRENAIDIISPYQIVADGTDNFQTRYLVNDACVLAGKINVYASIQRFEGQVAVFNVVNKDGESGVNYRDLFPTPPASGSVLNCAEEGVLGVLPGIIGSMQASEVIKVITGFGASLANRIALFDAANFTMQVIKLKKTSNYQISELIDYDYFCNVRHLPNVNTISVHQLQRFMQDEKDIQLIDVRQPEEHDTYNIGGICIPLSELVNAPTTLFTNKKTILYCQSGNRSSAAIQDLIKKNKNIENVFSLEGGTNAWKKIYENNP